MPLAQHEKLLKYKSKTIALLCTKLYSVTLKASTKINVVSMYWLCL